MQANKLGILYVVATPIGNLDDITFRAVNILNQVDMIVAEDTRHSILLLRHLKISKPMPSLHDFNERERTLSLLTQLKAGQSLALISDAGTPLISDPGFYLVKEARLLGISVVPIPGACAAIAALSVAGLPTDRFVFEGFLSAKQDIKLAQLTHLFQEERTIICYEAPHRLVQTLQAIQQVFGQDRLICIAREISKHYESIKTDTVACLLTYYQSHLDEVRGEIVLLIAANKQQERLICEIDVMQVLDILLAELPLKQAVTLAAKLTKKRKNELYALAVDKKEGN